jgi:hypothetical protein
VSSYSPDYQTGGGNYDNIVAKFTSPLNNREYSFGMAGGTSMSAPATSGIVAMMLQINPNLSPADVKELFRNTAIKDSYTGVIPEGGSTTWGNGKVNAMGVVRRLLAPVTGIVYQMRQPSGLLLYPNPGNGQFRLVWESQSGAAVQLSLRDKLGREFRSWQETGQEFDVNLYDVPPGIYFLHGRRGSEVAVMRLVKE